MASSMLEWVSWHAAPLAIVLFVALACARNRRWLLFLLVTGVLGLLAIAAGAMIDARPGHLLALALWISGLLLPVLALFAVLVARGKHPQTMIVTSLVLVMLLPVLSFLGGIVLACRFGVDCP